MEFVPRVLANMRGYATLHADGPSGQYLIRSLHSEPLDPPAKLRITERDASAYAMRRGTNSGHVFPGSTQEEAGLAFLLIHLDETFATKVGAGTTVTVTARRLVVTDPVEMAPFDVDPDGEYYWSADKPDDFS